MPAHNALRTETEWRYILQKEYIAKRKSCKVVGKEYNCSGSAVRRALRRYGFKVRGTAEGLRGTKRPKEFCLAVSKGMKGVNTWMSGSCLSDTTKQKLSVALSGSKNPNWKGGKTSVGIRIRTSQKYLDWRLNVFERDGFKCVGCGDDKGGNLEAHHILHFAKNPKLRLEISNGTTLCKSCHAKMHPEVNLFNAAEILLSA